MNPQQCDVFIYAHSLKEVQAVAPLLQKFRTTPGKKAYLVISGGQYCPCEDAASLLGWSKASCHDRRFKVFDLEVKFFSNFDISSASLTHYTQKSDLV
jgi:hypothetical protein